MNFSKPSWAAAFAATLIFAAACGGNAGTATPQAPSGPSSSPTSSSAPTLVPAGTPSATATAGATASAAVDLSGLDACTLLDEQTVQELTGTSLKFMGVGNGGDCFYGATTPEPPYVDISVFARPTSLSGYTFNADSCTRAPVEGVGSEAFGGTCVISSQDKVYLVAWDRGVAVRVLVNEPQRALTPQDLGATITKLLEEIE